MPTAKRIIKNTAFLSSAFIGQKILSFIYFTLIARLAGVSDTGGYVFALSFTTIFSVFVDFGLAPLLQREIARHPDKTQTILSKALGLKSIYALGAIALAISAALFMGLEGTILTMILIALGLMVFDSFNLSVWSVFRGHHQLQYESFAVIVSQLITLSIGLTGLVLGLDLTILVIALLIGSISTSLFAGIQLKRKLDINPIPSYKNVFDKQMITESIPFGFAGAFTRVFSAIDSVLLKQLAGTTAVGYYAVPNKIVFALQFIPSAFAASIYPAMSHLYKQDKQKMIKVFEQSVLFLLILSIPLAVGIFLLTPTVIHELYTTEFDASIPAMYILVWGVIFGFTEFPMGSLLSAIGQQRKNTITRGIVMTVNVILNIILIPMYSFIGASIAAVISYALLTGLGVYWVNKYVDINWGYLVKATAQIIFASILMGGFVWFLLGYLHFFLVTLFAIVLYAFLIVWLNVVSMTELKSLLANFKRS